MSQEYKGENLLDLATQAEQDLNSNKMKRGENNNLSDSARESGVDEGAAERFPGGSVTVGSAASGAGGNRDIPPEEGGSYDDRGRLSKARDFEGQGGPEDKIEQYAQDNPGSDDVRENIRNESQGNRNLS